jgi:hypothetical protein
MKIYNELYKYRLLKDRKSIDHYNIIYNRFITLCQYKSPYYWAFGAIFRLTKQPAHNIEPYKTQRRMKGFYQT